MWMYIYVLQQHAYIILAIMFIYVICKCLSWGGNQQQDLGKPS